MNAPQIAVRFVLSLIAALMLLVSGNAAAQYVQRRPVEARNPADPVYTRARVASVSEDTAGQWYVMLKLLPRAKVPFTTLTFRTVLKERQPATVANRATTRRA